MDLPHWLDEQLWEVEVDGQIVEDTDKMIVERARLVAPVGAWPDVAVALIEDCVLHDLRPRGGVRRPGGAARGSAPPGASRDGLGHRTPSPG